MGKTGEPLVHNTVYIFICCHCQVGCCVLDIVLIALDRLLCLYMYYYSVPVKWRKSKNIIIMLTARARFQRCKDSRCDRGANTQTSPSTTRSWIATVHRESKWRQHTIMIMPRLTVSGSFPSSTHFRRVHLYERDNAHDATKTYTLRDYKAPWNKGNNDNKSLL